jgi:hypothetical protein
VQIPGDLSPPDEDDAVRVPPDVGGSVARPTEECLESPPTFSGGFRPGARTTEPAEPAPASDEPVDPDRVIEN